MDLPFSERAPVLSESTESAHNLYNMMILSGNWSAVTCPTAMLKNYQQYSIVYVPTSRITSFSIVMFTENAPSLFSLTRWTWILNLSIQTQKEESGADSEFGSQSKERWEKRHFRCTSFIGLFIRNSRIIRQQQWCCQKQITQDRRRMALKWLRYAKNGTRKRKPRNQRQFFLWPW